MVRTLAAGYITSDKQIVEQNGDGPAAEDRLCLLPILLRLGRRDWDGHWHLLRIRVAANPSWIMIYNLRVRKMYEFWPQAAIECPCSGILEDYGQAHPGYVRFDFSYTCNHFCLSDPGGWVVMTQDRRKHFLLQKWNLLKHIALSQTIWELMAQYFACIEVTVE